MSQCCTFKAGARQGKARKRGEGPGEDLWGCRPPAAEMLPLHSTAQDHMTTLHSIGPHDHTPLQSTRPHHMTTQNSTAPHDFTFGLHSKQCTVILDFAMHKKCNAINVDKEKYKS